MGSNYLGLTITTYHEPDLANLYRDYLSNVRIPIIAIHFRPAHFTSRLTIKSVHPPQAQVRLPSHGHHHSASGTDIECGLS